MNLKYYSTNLKKKSIQFLLNRLKKSFKKMCLHNLKVKKVTIKYLEKEALIESLKNLSIYPFRKERENNKKLIVSAFLLNIENRELFLKNKDNKDFSNIISRIL